MRFEVLLLGLAILPSLVAASEEHRVSTPMPLTRVECAVTTPNCLDHGKTASLLLRA